MSQFAKVLKTLDLFSEKQSTLAAEEIADLLGVSRPTAFRYVKQLCETGLLTKLAGRYALGARIIELDYRIRLSDPILLASRERMKALANQASSTVSLCSVYGSDIVQSHYEVFGETPPMSLERGHPMPLFRGAASAIILAHLAPARLRKIFDAHQTQDDVLAIAHGWPGFARHYKQIRKAGFYISREEIDPGVIGVAAPIFNDGQVIVGSLVLIYETNRARLVNEQGYAELVRACAADISRQLGTA